MSEIGCLGTHPANPFGNEKNVGWPGDGQLGLEFAFCGYSPVKSLKKKRKALRGVVGVLLVAWPWGVSVARAQKHQSKKPGTHV